VYDSGVGPGYRSCFALRFDSPNDVADLLPQKCIVWGAKAKPPVSPNSSGGFAVTVRVARKCVMAGRVNWSRSKQRGRMHLRGVEDIRGAMPVVAQPPKQPRRKLSKAELREQAEAAFRAWREGQTSKNK
jgi:hypothetical protein